MCSLIWKPFIVDYISVGWDLICPWVCTILTVEIYCGFLLYPPHPLHGSNGDDIQQLWQWPEVEEMCDSTSHALPLKYDYFSFLILGWFCFHLPLAWFSGLHLVSWASVSWVYLFSYLMKLNELGVFVCLFCLFATNYSDWYTPLLSHWKNPTHCFHLFVPFKYAPGGLAFLNLWDLNKFFYVERVPPFPK